MMVDFRKYEKALGEWLEKNEDAYLFRGAATGDLIAGFNVDSGEGLGEEFSINLTDLAKHLADEVTA